MVPPSSPVPVPVGAGGGLEQAVQGRQQIAGCHGWLIIEGRLDVLAGDLRRLMTWSAQLARSGKAVEALMETVRHYSLGQISEVFFQAGRRIPAPRVAQRGPS